MSRAKVIASPPPPPMGERSIVMTVFVCLSVCWPVHEHISRTTRPIFTKLLVRYLCSRLGPPLVALRYVTFFRFMDDVIFLYIFALDKFWKHQSVKFDFTADLTGTGNRSEEVIK